MNRFLSPEPIVKIEKAFSNPFRNLVATAQTCYSGKGIVRQDNITEDYRKLAKSIYKAGHHTTLQHAHFQFSISNVSRQFVWSFLHSHPFYNSEQVSQRYVEVKPENFLVPSLADKEEKIYTDTIKKQMAGYFALMELIEKDITDEYFRIYPGRK